MCSSLLVLEFISIPIPMMSSNVPDVYRYMAKDKEDYTVLEIPMGWVNSSFRNGVISNAAQYYETVHGKRIFNGNAMRSRKDKILYYTDIPVIKSIIDLQDGKELKRSDIDRDILLANDIFKYYNVRYILIHPPYNDERIVNYIKGVTRKDYEIKDGIVVFKLDPDEKQPGAGKGNRSDMWFGLGWYTVGMNGEQIFDRWSSNTESTLYLYLEKKSPCVLKLGMYPFPIGTSSQQVDVSLNGAYIGYLKLLPNSTVYNIPVSVSQENEGINTITLKFKTITGDTNKMVRPSFDQWSLGVALNSMKIDR